MTSQLSENLMAAISEVFSPHEVSLESTFDSLEATSVSMLRLMALLQGRFGVTLDVVDMFSVEDIGDLMQLVEERV
jgi:acyl carrier protein